MRRCSVMGRVREAVKQFVRGDRPMIVRDGDETYTITRRDVTDIMRACDCDEAEAIDRLADWVVDRMEGKR